ncbi:glutathione S-transferase family protein [Neorhizobium sp. JUb45]|uniref:glutathione S-transferase family protein n=1 Tax=unclassified Neorhizobium TaxID=2629175 RepID=UPI0010510D9A|nr:glutathione S-transferase family protein [Neorhizobium sp. JUb45]TCR01317.1 glutathione S-transferase [Neorhizobium sp. JUb45]
MDALTLYIGNKNYSSWSFRPWIALTAFDVPFEEVLIPFDFPAGNPRFAEISPSAKLPVLHHGRLRIWESLAIIEYVAELFPEKHFWPEDPGDRAMARAISLEMIAGFRGLRNACPMNMRRPRAALDFDAATASAVKDDVTRITTIWREMRERSGGPFLFGAFSAADAMYAPVVNRLDVYDIAVDADAQAYMDAMKATPAWQSWETAAKAESWIVAEDEA